MNSTSKKKLKTSCIRTRRDICEDTHGTGIHNGTEFSLTEGWMNQWWDKFIVGKVGLTQVSTCDICVHTASDVNFYTIQSQPKLFHNTFFGILQVLPYYQVLP